MKRIIAIGGGELKNQETLPIDKEIIKLTGIPHPKLLFIPTASDDSERYVTAITKIYGDLLGCKVDVLALSQDNISSSKARAKIIDSDVIYVGGGNTKKMLELWHKYEVDQHLKEAYERGTVLSGLSAGSICWFQYGHSDSQQFENKKAEYIQLEALGLIKGLHCPHFNEAERQRDFKEMISKNDTMGIAIENNCAIEFTDDSFRVLKSDENAKAYRIYMSDNKLVQEELSNDEYLPLCQLYKVQ